MNVVQTNTCGLLAGTRTSAEPTHFTDLYIPTGYILDVIRGGTRNLRDGCYTFGDILGLAAHHVVYTGEARAVEARLRAGVTARDFLRSRYGVAGGAGVSMGDSSDLKRFRLWMADSRATSGSADRGAHPARPAVSPSVESVDASDGDVRPSVGFAEELSRRTVIATETDWGRQKDLSTCELAVDKMKSTAEARTFMLGGSRARVA